MHFLRVQALARARGGLCLSTEYVNARTHLRWRCAEGHEWEAVPSSIVQGTWCPHCAGTTPLTLDDMREMARSRGGECLSTAYVNLTTRMRWRCAEGHEWEAVPNHCRRGSWCPYCAGRPPRTIEDMHGLARANGGKCLSRRYVNTQTHLRWRCAAGHEWEAAPSNITQGRWCPHCAGNIRRTIDDMREVAQSRGGECLSRRYLNAHTHLRWRCAEGHEWKTKPAIIMQGMWCPRCVKNAPLTIDDLHQSARAMGGECLSRSYRPSRPILRWRCAVGHEWTAHPRLVRAGRWCPRCGGVSRLTIERVHEVVASKGGVLLDTKYRSSTAPLRVRCSAGHGWRTTAMSIMSGTWCQQCWHEARRGQPAPQLTIRDMHDVASARGGTCLSEFYVNSRTKLRWRCHDGHEWEAAPAQVRHRSWCPKCAYLHRGTIDGMRALAVALGGVCLSEAYHNHRDVLRFGCARGHVFTATGMMVKSGVWCPTCAGRDQALTRPRSTKSKRPPRKRSAVPCSL